MFHQPLGFVQLIKGVFQCDSPMNGISWNQPPRIPLAKKGWGWDSLLKMKRRHQSSWWRLLLRTSKEGHWMVVWISPRKEFLPNFTIKTSPKKNIHWQIDRDENRPTHLVKKLMAIKKDVAIEATFMLDWINRHLWVGKKMKLLKLGTYLTYSEQEPFFASVI